MKVQVTFGLRVAITCDVGADVDPGGCHTGNQAFSYSSGLNQLKPKGSALPFSKLASPASLVGQAGQHRRTPSPRSGAAISPGFGSAVGAVRAIPSEGPTQSRMAPQVWTALPRQVEQTLLANPDMQDPMMVDSALPMPDEITKAADDMETERLRKERDGDSSHR